MADEEPDSGGGHAAVLIDTDGRGVATATLNRPKVNNAYDGDMINGLLNAIDVLAADPAVRIVVIRGNGRLFQAGADLTWLAEVAECLADENLLVSRKTTEVVRRLDHLAKPTIALIHGDCFGRGMGLLAACDVVIASAEARFSIPEVRWGLVPGPVVPQLAAKMGIGALRRYALTGERFGADEAARIGLVHEVCATGALDAAAAPIIEALLRNGPEAVSETKATILDIAGKAVDDAVADRLARTHAARRRTAEAAEGLASFRERREADWYPQPPGGPDGSG